MCSEVQSKETSFGTNIPLTRHGGVNEKLFGASMTFVVSSSAVSPAPMAGLGLVLQWIQELLSPGRQPHSWCHPHTTLVPTGQEQVDAGQDNQLSAVQALYSPLLAVV